MKRVVVVLFALAALLTIGGPGAWAGIEPGLDRPPNVVVAGTCTINPGPETVTTSAKASSVNVSYRGMTCTVATAAHIGIDLWTQDSSGHWTWTYAVGAVASANGTVAMTCKHLANVKASIAYYAYSGRFAKVWTHVARCS